MRPLLVLIMGITILGSVQAFLSSGARLITPPPTVHELVDSSETYDVELTLTFDAGPDAFSIESADEAPSLLVQLNGQSILRRTDEVAVSESPILLREVHGMVRGRNELFVQASPVNPEARPAVRVRIFQNEVVKAETTMWPEFGGVVQGAVVLEVSE